VAHGVAHHGLSQAHAQRSLGAGQGLHRRSLIAVEVQARRLVQRWVRRRGIGSCAPVRIRMGLRACIASPK